MKSNFPILGLFIVLAAPGLRADILPPPSSTNGLVAYYTFTGNANDSSGRGHDGVVQGATLTTDRFGNANNAYFFNGNAIIDIASSTDFDFLPANGLTISAWVFGTAFSDPEHLVGRRGGGNYWQMAIGTGAINTSHLPVNQWFQYVLTFGGSSQGYYVNGVLDTTQLFSIGAATDNIDVFIGGSGGFTRFSGSLDDVRIYNRILSPGEIQDLYQYEVPEPGALTLFGAGAAIFLFKRGRRSSRR